MTTFQRLWLLTRIYLFKCKINWVCPRTICSCCDVMVLQLYMLIVQAHRSGAREGSPELTALLDWTATCYSLCLPPEGTDTNVKWRCWQCGSVNCRHRESEGICPSVQFSYWHNLPKQACMLTMHVCTCFCKNENRSLFNNNNTLYLCTKGLKILYLCKL